MKTAYSLDDVLLLPKFNPVKSRLDTNLSTPLTRNCLLKIPVMSTNMSTVTEYPMMKAMSEAGGIGILHRFMSIEETENQIKQAIQGNLYRYGVSIGVGVEEYQRGLAAIETGAPIILIDVAHGHSEQVFKQYERLKKKHPQTNYIVGNVGTYEATKAFIEAGVDAVRIGIGPGSRCTTRLVTGHGVPNLTAIVESAKARDEYYKITNKYVPLILDGGLKHSGDAVKALYFGADVCCFGNLFAGTEETPGEVKDGYKEYYGMASKEAQDTHRAGVKPGTAPEGFSERVPFKGSVKPILEELVGGIRSGLTYSGATNLKELRSKGEAVYLSAGAQYESKLR